MPHSSSLTGDPTALDIDQDVKFVQCVTKLERLPDDHPMDFIKEMRLEWPTVHPDVSGSWPHENSSSGRLPSARAVILN